MTYIHLGIIFVDHCSQLLEHPRSFVVDHQSCCLYDQREDARRGSQPLRNRQRLDHGGIGAGHARKSVVRGEINQSPCKDESCLLGT